MNAEQSKKLVLDTWKSIVAGDVKAAFANLTEDVRWKIPGNIAGMSGVKNGKSEITRLGLKYNLLTRFTSFIAVHDVVRNPAANSTDVEVALPLPLGVSDSAVGIHAGPEPELWILVLGALALAGAMSLRDRRRRCA